MLIVIFLISLVGGLVGLRMNRAVERRKFLSEITQLKGQFAITQKLAIAMQADWKGTLKKEGNQWVFQSVCEEIEGKKLSPLSLHHVEFRFNGKKVKEFTIDFFASGQTFPIGTLILTNGEEKVEWKLEALFSREMGKKQGPTLPL